MLKKAKNIGEIGIILLVLAVLGSCSAPVVQKPVKRNMAFMYNPSSSPLHPEFIVYHEGNDYSRLYIRVYPVELLFNQANREGIYQAKLKVHYELREIVEGKEKEVVADSSTAVFNLKMNEIKNIFISSIHFKAEEGKKYLLKIYTTDLKRNKGTVNYINVNKSSVNTAQNFKIISAKTGYPSFDYVFKSNEIFSIHYNKGPVDSIYIKYFRNRFPMPRPPVTNLSSPKPDFIPDSIYAYPYSDTIKYVFPWEGMYHVQVVPRQPGGLTLHNFGDHYPEVTTVNDMIGPLAYLTSSVEFNDIISQTNKKLAIDNFWLRNAGNVSSARELIKVYYNRVFYANYYFSSYKEGWKTDRGMMFIIYGPPNNMSKAAETEMWTYYRKKGKEPLRFTFVRTENPFSDNDYLLERNFVNSMWAQAVQDWRRGKVFYTDN